MKLAFWIVTLACPLLLSAQNAPLAAPIPGPASQAPSPPPSKGAAIDPIALLSAAHEKNGLDSPDVRPWHIRVTYNTFDVNGKPEDSGVYEEWWASPTRYKRVYAGTKFKQTEYATGTDLYRDGSLDWLGGSELRLRASLLEPLPGGSVLKDFTPQMNNVSFGQNTLRCIRLFYALPSANIPNDFFRTLCFSLSAPVLRLDSQGANQTTYNDIFAFQGHFLARHLNRTINKNTRFDLKLDVVEALKDSPDTLFAPLASSSKIDINTRPLKLTNGDQLIRLKDTIYRTAEVEGHVVVRIVVGENGHVISQQAENGTFSLRQPVLDASRQWTFVPFSVMGKPKEVEADVKLDFSSPYL